MPNRERLSLNQGWKFTKNDPPGVGDTLAYQNLKAHLFSIGSDLLENPPPVPGVLAAVGADVTYAQPQFDDKAWRSLDLPHDWGIEGPFKQEYPGETGKLPWWGVGWYRKHFQLSDADRGRQIYLDIDGAMSYSSVWVNGKYVGGWPYGYTSYRLDLTPHIKPGADNVLAIRLDNPPDSSRWYPGGGIYRNVWLVKTNAVHIAQWGTSITTPEVGRESATVEARVTLENRTAAEVSAVVTTQAYLIGEKGQRTAQTKPARTRVTIAARSRGQGMIIETVAAPKLWDVSSPTRYVAVTTVEQDGQVVDQDETVFGIRTVVFHKDNGLALNGKRVPLNGVCNHHDLGALGAAINVRAIERQLEILKEMGVNAIRTSHNPPAPELLDLCDRMGFVVIDEFTDTWRRRKKPNGYNLLFDEWHEKDLRAMIRRDRNHPSVVLWSTGNEVNEQQSAEGRELSSRLTAIVRSEDPTRPATVGCNIVPAGYNGFQKTMDVFGYNYKPGEYAKFHGANPDQPLIGSETASTISTRGEYHFPVSDDKGQGRSGFHVSSYDLYAPRWAMSPDAEFQGQDENPFVLGEFVWTGFDYLGEPTPYNSDTTTLGNFADPAERARAEEQLKELGKIRVPSRSSYFGIIDLAGFKKDRFYIYQARWRPDLPMAHILPHWNWPDRIGQVTPVHVYSSGDEAELFLNGRSLGRQTRDRLQYRFRWNDVTYEPGELKVVTYKAGKPWAQAITRTTGNASKLALEPDRTTLRADGQDLAFVTLKVTDASGLTVPRALNPIRFAVTGPAEIIATDNGDPTSHESFQSQDRKAFNGLCLVILRAKQGVTGKVSVTATAKGLETATVEMTASITD